MADSLQGAGKRPDQGKQAKDINAAIRYTMFTAFAQTESLPTGREHLSVQLSQMAQRWAETGVQVRGWYDVAGMRADADLLLWTHGPSVEGLQAAYHDVRRSSLGAHLRATWSNVGMHQPAEFNKSHVPAFLAGEPARRYLCLYPFVRSYEWYLLPEQERRALLVEHGMMGREYPDVRANTVSGFALGDYEWLLAFEADELHRIVALMRHLRGSGARRHVREETPFFTGPRRPLAALIADLP